VVRHGPRGHAYRAHRVYVAPRYHRRAVYVRPVRLYFGANVRIGGVYIRAGNDPHAGYAYGCNFCDTRFGVYGAYAAHVAHCDARPDGYRVYARDWEGEDWDSGRRGRYEGEEWDSDRRERYEDEEWDR
jgi:hypothetical protein